MTEEILKFDSVKKEHLALIHDWLNKKHVQPYFYGEGLQNTLKNLSLFVNGIKRNDNYTFEHWIAYIDDKPFAFLMTSLIEGPYNPAEIYNKWYEEGKETITLDLLIGEEEFLGRGLAHSMIQAFLLDKFSHISKVMIDPAERNSKAIHVYEKAGFKKVGTFYHEQDLITHWMMQLKLEEINKS